LSSPATVSFGAAGGALHIETIGPIPLARGTVPLLYKSSSSPQIAPALRISSALADAGNLISAARLLGWDISRGWDLTGPVRSDLKWQGSSHPWTAIPTGTIDFGVPPTSVTSAEPNAKSGGDSLRVTFLNLPIEQIRAHVDLKSNARHVALISSEAFGAHWSGSFDRHDPVGEQKNPWQFALRADHLSVADLDRWLNPRWRESFLDRVLPFLNSRPPAAAQPENLVSSGKISVEQFTLAPLVLRRVQADASIDGRHFAFSNVHAQLAKGDVSGSLRADLQASPSYRLTLDYSGIDLYALTASAPSLADRFAGSAMGNISIVAKGSTRADLISSLQCRGAARIAGAELMNIDLRGSFSDGAFRPGHSAFRDASTDFTCTSGKIVFERLRLSSPAEGFTAQGTADFSRNLDFRFVVLSDSATTRSARLSDSPSYRLTGDLSEPEINRVKRP
jgi:AsmA-like C-terminal region